MNEHVLRTLIQLAVFQVLLWGALLLTWDGRWSVVFGVAFLAWCGGQSLGYHWGHKDAAKIWRKAVGA